MSDPQDPESIKQPMPHEAESAGEKKARLDAEHKVDVAEGRAQEKAEHDAAPTEPEPAAREAEPRDDETNP